jgi:hypothetical protein
VIREIEIWGAAVLMVNRYADEAEANSFQRAEELAAEGDHAGAAIWRRVTVAIEQLTDTTGPLKEKPRAQSVDLTRHPSCMAIDQREAILGELRIAFPIGPAEPVLDIGIG